VTPAPSPSEIRSRPASDQVDLSAVKISDLLFLYADLVDPQADLVICPDAVIDDRLVTVRSKERSRPVIQKALADAGYIVSYQDGLLSVCRSHSVAGAPATAFGPGTPSDALPDQPGAYPEGSAPPSSSSQSRALVKADNRSDALWLSGARFVGCAGVPGDVVIVFHHDQFGRVAIPEKEYNGSDISRFAECRGMIGRRKFQVTKDSEYALPFSSSGQRYSAASSPPASGSVDPFEARSKFADVANSAAPTLGVVVR